MFKRRVAFILAVLTIMSVVGFYAAASAAATLTVDGISIKATVRTKSGESLFPIRLICEALGSKGYKYSYKSGKATITAPDDVYKVTKGSKTYYYDNGGDSIRLSIAPALYSSMLYVPESFMTDMMGFSYSKDSAGNHVLKSIGSTTTTTTPGTVPGVTPPAGTLGNIYLNEKQLTGNAYTNTSGYLMVPLQPLVQAHSGTMSTTGTTSIIMVNGTYFYIDPSQTMFNYNGQQLMMPTKPELSNGILYVPIAVIEKVFSATYNYQNGILKLTSSAGIASAEYAIRLNGQLLSVKGYSNLTGKYMLPVKTIGEALGWTVSASSSGVVTCTKSGNTISFTPGSTSYNRNWGTVTYPASEIRNNDVFVPVEFLTTELGLSSAELLNNEITITASGYVAGGIPIKFSLNNGSFMTESVYAKASANGQTVLIPINTLAGRFGYKDYMVSGNKIILERISDTAIANIEITLDSTYYVLKDSSVSARNITFTSQSKSEMNGMTLYVPMDVLQAATGIRYSGSATTGVEILPPA